MDTRFQYSAYRYFLIWGVLSSLVLTISTFVDATLVGNTVGNEGLAIYNLCTPVFLFYALIGVTIGVGANVNIIRLLGKGKVEDANKVFHSELTLGLILALLSLSPFLFERAYASFLGITDELYPLSRGYLDITICSGPVFIMYHIISASVRSDSDPSLCARASGVVCITNIVLDVVTMKILKIGIRGAAISLMTGECLGLLVLLSHFFKKNRLLNLSLKLPSFKDVWEYIAGGFGLGSAYVFSAVVMLFFNTMLLKYGGNNGTLAVAVYGVIYTLSTVPTAVFDGNASAMQTVISFLLGESDSDGIFAVLRRALVVITVISIVIAIIFSLLSAPIVTLFGISGDDVKEASTALSLFMVSVIFGGINTTLTSFWVSIGRIKLSSLMSAVRNCVLLLLFGLLLVPGRLNIGLALTYIITEIAATVIILLIYRFNPSRSYVKKNLSEVYRSFEKTYPIKKESMSEISMDLERITEDWAIDAKRSFMINFISEELMLNIIKFALNESEKSGYYISIKLIDKKDDLVLRIRDNVREYNPFEAEGDEIDSGVLLLIKKKTKYADYQRKMVFNYFYTII